MTDTPYIGLSNETLNAQPELQAGDKIPCKGCGGEHEVRSGDGVNPGVTSILWFRCGEKTYIAGINGRSVLGVKADVNNFDPSRGRRP